LKIEESVHEES
jgi:NhaP-type Na+/H+ and K+/H+ antiporter